MNPLLSEFESCCICQEDILSKPRCILDCSHCFHTQCIVDWFRAPRDDSEEIGTCPLCRSIGTPRGPFSWKTANGRASILRKLARKKKNNIPPIILKAVKRLQDAEKNAKFASKQFTEFKNKKEVKEMWSKWEKLRTLRYRANHIIRTRKYELAQFDPMVCISFFS